MEVERPTTYQTTNQRLQQQGRLWLPLQNRDDAVGWLVRLVCCTAVHGRLDARLGDQFVAPVLLFGSDGWGKPENPVHIS